MYGNHGSGDASSRNRKNYSHPIAPHTTGEGSTLTTPGGKTGSAERPTCSPPERPPKKPHLRTSSRENSPPPQTPPRGQTPTVPSRPPSRTSPSNGQVPGSAHSSRVSTPNLFRYEQLVIFRAFYEYVLQFSILFSDPHPAVQRRQPTVWPAVQSSPRPRHPPPEGAPRPMSTAGVPQTTSPFLPLPTLTWTRPHQLTWPSLRRQSFSQRQDQQMAKKAMINRLWGKQIIKLLNSSLLSSQKGQASALLEFVRSFQNFVKNENFPIKPFGFCLRHAFDCIFYHVCQFWILSPSFPWQIWSGWSRKFPLVIFALLFLSHVS